MTKIHINKKKFRKSMTSLLIIIVLLLSVFFLYKHYFINPDSSFTNEEDTTEPLSLTQPNYDELYTFLEGEQSNIELISSIEFTATNPTDTAIAGSAITYGIDIYGYNTQKEYITEHYNSITIEEDASANDYIKIRDNVVIFYDNSTEPKDVSIPLSFHSQEHTFTYSVIKQLVSEDNYAMIINNYTGLDSNYIPSDLTRSDYITYTNGYDSEVSPMKEVCTKALEDLILDAQVDGYEIYACSGYRDYITQEILYNRAILALGEDQIDTAHPGCSEHQSGFTMDVVFPDISWGLTVEQENSPCYTWMRENAHKYGFILSYEEGYEDISGYMFEPWHYRFIGVELATQYYEEGFKTLTEFASIPRY